jgi:hypothetical protein
LYIPERIIENALSLEDALRQMLWQSYPNLDSKEVDDIPLHLPAGSPYVIVVDDVNQTSNPPELIRKLVGWGRDPYLIVCPAWPRFWNLAKAANIKAQVGVISIDRMPFGEAILAVQRVVETAGCLITGIDTRKIVGRLQGDPLLIGTFGALLRRDPDGDMTALADNAVEMYIAEYIDEAASASQTRYFAHEYRESLEFLTATMLRQISLYPTWNQVEAWLQSNPKQLSIIRALASRRKICQVSDAGEFRFQHDRFLEFFSVRAISSLLAQPAEHQEVLAEPYYAEFIGRALVKSPQSEPVLNEMLHLNPLALCFSLREIGTPTIDYHHMIIQKVQSWVKYVGTSHKTPETLRAAVANCFINTDSPAILDIVHTHFDLEVPWLGYMARLRNGDLESGIKLFTQVGADYRNSLVTELVEHAKRYHEEGLRTALLQSLSTPMDERAFKGTVVLAGYLAFPGVQEAIVSSWLQQPDRANQLNIAIWAVLRSSGVERDNPFLDTLIEYWAEMPDIEGENRAENQLHIAKGVRRLLGDQADRSIVQTLIEQGQKRPRLGEAVAYICGLIDLPDAIEFAVRQAALQEDWCLSSLTQWAWFDKAHLSVASTSRLQEMWQSDENAGDVRLVAFTVWLTNVDRNAVEVLPLLHPISADSPLYIQALQERASLGDTTCVPALLEQLDAYPYLYRAIDSVWNEDLKQAVAARLQSFSDSISPDFLGEELNEHRYLAQLLTHIPELDAESLLVDYWPYLQYSGLFVQAAIYVGTSKTLALVDEIIDKYPPENNPFEHLWGIYGFEDRSPEKRLTLKHLKHLGRFIGRLTKGGQLSCADFCYRQGGEFIDWCVKHLSSEVNEGCRFQYPQTDEDILRNLDFESGYLRNYTLYLLDEFRKKNDPRKFLEILKRWLQDKPTWQKIEAAAYCVERIGSRADVAILDVPLEYGWEKSHIQIVRESARFGICRRTLS